MPGVSLEVQQLRLQVSTAGGVSSIPGWGTKIQYLAWRGTDQKKEKKKVLPYHPHAKSPSFFLRIIITNSFLENLSNDHIYLCMF